MIGHIVISKNLGVDCMEIVIDIETTGLDPFTHRIIGVGVFNINSKTVDVKFSKDESELIRTFWDYYMRATTIIGFNIKRFDIHFVAIRSLKHGIELPDVPKRVIDILEILSFNQQKKMRRLSTVANFLGIDVKDRDASQIPSMWEEGRIEELEEYLKKDLELTADIYQKMSCVGFIKFKENGFI